VTSRRWLSTIAPRLVTAVTLAVAGLPLILNWQAATRRPDALLATTFGEALLASAPPNAVLLVAGDNDSYTTWYRQAVLGERACRPGHASRCPPTGTARNSGDATD
jgi:hypothetical protein